MGIVERLSGIKLGLPESVKLVAVSKTKSVEAIMEAYNGGQRIFGENRVQEIVDKQPKLPGDIEWHHIGHLQTNKVKYIAPFIDMIHAVDSEKLLIEIDRQAKKNDRQIPCLLQVHIAEEETKFGLSEQELEKIIFNLDQLNLKNTKISGLMGMATYTIDDSQVKKEFRNLKSIFDRIKKKNLCTLVDFKELSMGMSGDYTIAIEEGSTMVRIGSLIFGSRH